MKIGLCASEIDIYTAEMDSSFRGYWSTSFCAEISNTCEEIGLYCVVAVLYCTEIGAVS